MRWVALLRGINVGGKNVIKMSDLAACFRDLGYADVTTYIQSGNVVFGAGRASAATLTKAIERALGDAFGYAASVVLRSATQLREIVDAAPKGFGREPARYRYDVVFLKAPLTATDAMRSVVTAPGVDTAQPGDGVLYFTRLIAKASQSRLARLTGTAAYQQMTIRNFNTTMKLLDMVER